MYLCYPFSQSRKIFRRRYQNSVLVWLKKEFVKLLLRGILCAIHGGDCLFSGRGQVRPGTLLHSMLGPQQGTCPSRGASYSPFGWLSSWGKIGVQQEAQSFFQLRPPVAPTHTPLSICGECVHSWGCTLGSLCFMAYHLHNGTILFLVCSLAVAPTLLEVGSSRQRCLRAITHPQKLVPPCFQLLGCQGFSGLLVVPSRLSASVSMWWVVVPSPLTWTPGVLVRATRPRVASPHWTTLAKTLLPNKPHSQYLG